MFQTEKNSIQVALAPTGDRYNTNPASDIFNLKEAEHICFVLEEGAGGTGTATITAEECTDVTGAGNVAIPFRYRLRTAPGKWGAIASATASGYTTVAGANKAVAIEIDANELSPSKPCIRLVLTEVVNSPVDAGVFAIIGPVRYADAGALDPTV